MSSIITSIEDAYNTYFGSGYVIPKASESPQKTTSMGTSIATTWMGREVLLPVTLWIDDNNFIEIPCATVRVSIQRTVVRTPLAERAGTVKELYGQDDYKFTIKGVLINRWDNLPDDKILLLKRIFMSTRPVELRCAYTDLFLEYSKRVALISLDFPEIEGKSLRMRSFVLQAESDYINDLIL